METNYDKTPLQFMISADLKQWLRDCADTYGVSMGAIIRLALVRYRAKEEGATLSISSKES